MWNRSIRKVWPSDLPANHHLTREIAFEGGPLGTPIVGVLYQLIGRRGIMDELWCKDEAEARQVVADTYPQFPVIFRDKLAEVGKLMVEAGE